jgi:GxxExxY protein
MTRKYVYDFVAFLFIVKYSKMELLLKDEVYAIVGCCIDVWKTLGYGFSEVIYKDAMEIEFIEEGVPNKREEELSVFYKGKILTHKFKADFMAFDNIIIEVKSGDDGINNAVNAQTLNYMKASGCRIGLIINFSKSKMEYKRLIM